MPGPEPWRPDPDLVNPQGLATVRPWNPAVRRDCLPGHDAPPVELPEPNVPSVPQPPQAADRDETDPKATPRIDALEKRLAALLGAVEKLATMQSQPGPQGEKGPAGPAGKDGRDGERGPAGEVPDQWQVRIAALEALVAGGINFELYSPDGQQIDREQIPLGGTLRLRLYPQTQSE